MSVWSSPRIVAAIVAIAVACIGCGGAGHTGSTPAPPPTATAALTPEPRSAAPTSTPMASASISSEPPAATLRAEGGDPMTGQLGSYTWAGSGSDSPWLPGAPMTVGAREPLTVVLGGGVALVEWSARRVPAGVTSGNGALAMGSGGPPATFVAPGPGRWSVQVAIRFAGDLGSATYYWDLTIR